MLQGYYLRALKMMNVPKELAEEHYVDLSSKPFYPGLVKYIARCALLLMSNLEGMEDNRLHAVLEHKAPVCSAADTALACFPLWQCSMQKSDSRRTHGMIQEWGLARVFVCCVQRPSGGNSMGGQGSGCHRQEACGRHQPPGIRCAFADASLALTHRPPLPPALHSGKMYHRRVPWKLNLIP